jgi:hypothetical protein
MMSSPAGAKILEVPVRHHARKFGQGKYGLERTLKVILDLIAVQFLTRYSAKPIYLFGGGGILMFLAGFFGPAFLAARKLLLEVDILTSPIFIISVLLALMGLIAELLVRTCHESQQKPTYTVRQVMRDGKDT